MTFYHKCLGGELTLLKLGDTPMKDQLPTALHDRISYSQLKNHSISISATDWLHPTRKPNQGNTVAIYITGDYPEAKKIFEHLSVGAPPELLDELRQLPFGVYGHLADKFGVHWFFNCQKPT